MWDGTMSHIVNECHLMVVCKDYLADDDAINWMERMAMKALTK